MCGRFINLTKANTLKKIFNIKNANNKNLLSYNISPSQNSHIIYKEKIINLDEAEWGYSFFDKKNYQEKKIINSRLETISEKIFSIITKIANKHISSIHHRMPILLSINEGDDFLNDNKSIFLTNNHTSKIEQELDFYPVSNFVNNPMNNSKKCIEFLN